MSETANDLLNLFSKLLHSPKFIMAIHMEMLRSKLLTPGNRKGAQGLLNELWKQDGLTNAEIAESLDIKPSSVTAQVNQLEEAGLAHRQTDGNDGRVSRVFLTEAGKKAQSDHRAHYDEISAEVFEHLNEEEQKQLRELIQKLIDSEEDVDWDWERFAGPAFHDFIPGPNSRELKRAMKEFHRARHDFRNDLRQQMRTYGIGGIEHGSKSKEESKRKNENWEDF